MRIIPAVLVLICSACMADAAPKITGEMAVNPGKLVRLKADQLPEKSTIRWRVTPAVDRADTVRELLQFTAVPGEYRVELLVVSPAKDGLFEIHEDTVSVKIGGAEPAPAPRPMPRPEPARAVSRIQFGNAGCTACPIGPRRPDGRWFVLTAAHCLGSIGETGTMTLQDSRRLSVRVVAINRKADCAWLLTEQAHDSLPFAELADADAAPGAEVWHAGYGVDKPGNREEGLVQSAASSDGQVQFLLSVSSGDSGGPIFEKSTNRVLSTVCCTTGRGLKVPMYGSGIKAIKDLKPGDAFNTGEEWTPLELPEKRAK